MLGFISDWLCAAIVAAILGAGCALASRLWRTQLSTLSSRLLFLAATLAVLAGSGGIARAVAVHWLVHLRAPWSMLGEVRAWDLSRGVFLAIAVAGAGAVAAFWPRREPRREVTTRARLLVAAVIVGGAGALAWVDARCQDGVYGLIENLSPAKGTPARFSAPTPVAREVELPPDLHIERLALGYMTDGQGYGRAWGCVTTADGVWCFAPESSAPAAERVVAGRIGESLDVGYGYGCALSYENALSCWGRAPHIIAEQKANVTMFDAAGLAGACWVARDNRVLCWGRRAN